MEKMGKVKKWEVEEVEKAKEMLEAGYSHREIGESLGRSKESVANKFRGMNCVNSKNKIWTQEEIENNLNITSEIDIECARKELKQTNKNYHNENFIFYAYIKEDIRVLDLRPLPKIKVDRKSTRLNSSHVSISY